LAKLRYVYGCCASLDIRYFVGRKFPVFMFEPLIGNVQLKAFAAFLPRANLNALPESYARSLSTDPEYPNYVLVI